MLNLSVYDFLRTKIISTEYAPGRTFYEIELAQELGVDRNKVVDALDLLAKDNLLDRSDGCAAIARLDLPAVLDSIFIVRSILMAIVKDAVSQPLDEPKVRKLKQDLLSIETETSYSNFEFFRADSQFYRVMSELNGFQRLNALIFAEKINIERALRVTLAGPCDYIELLRLYRRVVDGLLARDADKSIKAVCELANAQESRANLAKKKYPTLFK